MELSIIIVNFNTSDLLRKCLNKVYKALSFTKMEKASEVIVVDNASYDDSVPVVKKNFPKVVLITNSQNLGFARANNQGMKKSSGKYILLLNSDTEVEKEAIKNLLDPMRIDKLIGVVGGKLLNPDGSVQPSAGFLPNLSKIFFWMFFIDDIPFFARFIKPYHVEDKLFYSKKEKVDWVSGACFLVRREVLGKSGYLDENIFMYGEEVEWCYRIKKTGFVLMYLPNAHILHRKGASASGREPGIVEEFKAILYLYSKHKPKWQLTSVRLILKFGALLRLLTFGIIGRYRARRSLYAKAFRLA